MAMAPTANNTMPASQIDCGIQSWTDSGVLERLPVITSSKTSAPPRQAQKAAMAARLTMASALRNDCTEADT
jgi:hypothetical protein